MSRVVTAANTRNAHLAQAGGVLGSYSEIPLGAERFDAERHDGLSRPGGPRGAVTPRRLSRLARSRGQGRVAALVRDPGSSMQIWSRHHGYPGDEWYLEFHKMRWPGGLKFWRVSAAERRTSARSGPMTREAARARAGDHAATSRTCLRASPRMPEEGPGVIVAPFDTELFGHWWFEGVDFLGAIYRRLRERRRCVR